MLKVVIDDAHCIKQYQYRYGLPKNIKYSDLEIRIVRISSADSPYYALRYIENSWYPAVEFAPKHTVIENAKLLGKTEKDAYALSVKAITTAANAWYRN